MLNMFTIVGRIQDFKKEQDKNIIMVLVPRSYKNEEGIYETDLLTIETSEELYSSTYEWCKIGDLMVIKGTIQSNNTLIADKIHFLTSRKEDEE